MGVGEGPEVFGVGVKVVDGIREFGFLDPRPLGGMAVGRVREEDVAAGVEDEVVRAVEVSAAEVIEERFGGAVGEVDGKDAPD